MGPELTKVMQDLAFRMRLLKAGQEEEISKYCLSERELLMLELLSQDGQKTVSQLSASDPQASESTISTTITKLWRNKLVTKNVCPYNQRTTMVGLTKEGRKIIELLDQQRTQRFQTLFDGININEDEKLVIISVFSRAIQYFDNYLGINKNRV